MGVSNARPAHLETVEIMPGQTVMVYVNLVYGGYSVKTRIDGKWKVIARVPEITLTDVKFTVRPGTLARIRTRGQREVCAYAVGTVATPGNPGELKRKVTFRPATTDTFIYADTGERIDHAARVMFADDKDDNGNRRGYAWVA